MLKSTGEQTNPVMQKLQVQHLPPIAFVYVKKAGLRPV